MTKEITEGNKLIAEFMGGVYKMDYTGIDKAWHFQKSPDVKKVHFYELLYNSDWSWLMPVVEKIENLAEGGAPVNIWGDECRVKVHYDTEFYHNGGDKFSKIEATYRTVVDFIKWYNENK